MKKLDPHKVAVCKECGQTGLYKRPDGAWECGTCGRLFAGEPDPKKEKQPGKFVTRTKKEK